ncbi:MAG TPA: two-component regulator propeller domain-containing protein [Vicinamibacterales bacterium]
MRPGARRIALLGLIGVCVARAGSAERLPVKMYSSTDGLASNVVHRILQDSRGFLWIGTDAGVSRFDGYEFRNLGTHEGLPHPIVSDVLEARDGGIWLATGGGVCQLRARAETPSATAAGARGSSTRDPRCVVYAPPLADPLVWAEVLLQDRTGTIWCGLRGGLYRLDQRGGTWTLTLADIGLEREHPEKRGVLALLEDRNGALWVGAGNALYRRRADGRVDRFNLPPALSQRRGPPYVTSLLEDRTGRIWAGTTGGLCRLVVNPDASSAPFDRVFRRRDGLPEDWVAALLQASDGVLWIGTTRGLTRVVGSGDPASTVFQSYSSPEGTSHDQIMALGTDRDDNLWVASHPHGIARLTPGSFTTYDVADGLTAYPIQTVFETIEGTLCVVSGPSYTLHWYDGRRFHPVQPTFGRPIGYWGWSIRQTTFQDHTGGWWFATGEGVFRFPRVARIADLAHTKPDAVYTVRDGLSSNNVLRLFEDGRGDVWMTTISPGGVSRWERATGRLHSYAEEVGHTGPSVDDAATAFSDDANGDVWLGFYTGGLARYRAGRVRLFTTADGAPGGGVRALHLDADHRLWVATTRGGLGEIRHPDSDHPEFVPFPATVTLSSSDVSTVTHDQWNRLYVTMTGGGVDRVSLASRTVKRYAIADGLPSGLGTAVYRDHRGWIWIGGVQGLARFIPVPDRRTPPPPVLISAVRAGGDPVAISDLGERALSGPTLSPDRNQFEISFVGLDFTLGERLAYQYLLEGGDRQWSDLTTRRTITFANLRPGSYRFLVRAVTSDGTVSSAPSTVGFTILPPLWLRWWFLSLLAIGLGTAIHFAYRIRVARVLAIERLRTRIATDLHDDIGSSLTQIVVMSEVAQQQIGPELQTMARPLARIAHISRAAVESMGDIVWAINPQKDHVRDLVQRMRRFAGDLAADRDVALQFQASGQEDEDLSADIRRELFLVFKESLHNAVRHSGCRRIGVSLSATARGLVLTVTDDGRGFDASVTRPGTGLFSMHRRAGLLGGELSIDSGPARGTTVTLRVPFGPRRRTGGLRSLRKQAGRTGRRVRYPAGQ